MKKVALLSLMLFAALTVQTNAVMSNDDEEESPEFCNTDYSRAIKGDKNLFKAQLEKADLKGVDLSNADLRKAELEEADLREANLTDANLQDADLEEANLKGAIIDGANFKGAELEYAVWINGKVCAEGSVTVCR